MRDNEGRNVFAVNAGCATSGRSDAAYEDTKFLSKVGEYFLAGLLDGLPDGELHPYATGSI